MLKRFSFLALIVALIMVFSAGMAMALDKTGLVLYLPFDEGGGKAAKDASGNGNNGELQGDAKWMEGEFGTAVHLPAANDFVEVPHSDSLDIKKEITMEIWAKVDSLGPDPWCSFITKATDDFVGAYMLHAGSEAGQLCVDPLVFIDDDYGSWPSPARAITTLSEWHYIAASYDGAGI